MTAMSETAPLTEFMPNFILTKPDLTLENRLIQLSSELTSTLTHDTVQPWAFSKQSMYISVTPKHFTKQKTLLSNVN
jgi:hypothetical protein